MLTGQARATRALSGLRRALCAQGLGRDRFSIAGKAFAADEQVAPHISFARLVGLASAVLLGAGISFAANEAGGPDVSDLPVFCVDGDEPVAAVVAGAGTAGCTTAYLLARTLEQNKIPGKVVLLDRGAAFDAKDGPDPLMSSWWNNWGNFGEAHVSTREDGSDYPVTASSHSGVGGCGTHDTRITFLMRPEQRKRVAKEMGWEAARLDAYFQVALNLMPLTRAISTAAPEPFYAAWIRSLTTTHHERPLHRLPGDIFPAAIRGEAIAEPLMAMFDDELRWTSAYLVTPKLRPKNLVVVPRTAVDRVVFRSLGADLQAEGIVVMTEGKRRYLPLPRHAQVALTSGALGNVAILQRSGIGPREALKKLHIPVLVDNPEVGHGVDHQEIVVMYEWLTKWQGADGSLPRGGATGWPLIFFSAARGLEFMAHAGAGFAEPYTSFPSVVATPNCMRPDLATGFRAHITSRCPVASLHLVHADQSTDYAGMADAVLRTIELFDYMQADGVVGKRVLPPAEVNLASRESIVAWIADHHFSAFHWACTTRAGVHGPVADASFRVRTTPLSPTGGALQCDVISNLRVGSASALPELSEANPHLTITAFSVALADAVACDLARHHKIDYCEPREVAVARHDLSKAGGELKVRSPGQEQPPTRGVAQEYAAQWRKVNGP